MAFEFTNVIYITYHEFKEMVRLCKEEGKTPTQAFWEVAASWDDCEYYNAGFVEEKAVKILNLMLEGHKIDFD